MKRFLAILLMLAMLLSLCACTADPQPTDPGDKQPTDPVCQHNWLDATCTTPRTCSLCGTKEGYPTGHSWEEGSCTVCNAEDPSFDPLTNGTWLYLTKERWQIMDFHPDGTCDIKTVSGMPQSSTTLEEGVNAAVATLKRQYNDDWESYAANNYYVLKIKDYYYVARMTMTTVEYTTSGNNVTIEQEGFLPVYVELLSKNLLQDAITEEKYINMPVQFFSNLLIQYRRINEN